ncbi:uncharacterized protein LOC111219657 [Seriola dumerili]|uniref:uncharacterized protein LOC111219657 n=1 Tax=Seriola dumerili TaxID=41447 RepID=UPI000BBF0FB4|nr:uncharacterized protein LOC111219657 [Seriola dumerili]
MCREGHHQANGKPHEDQDEASLPSCSIQTEKKSTAENTQRTIHTPAENTPGCNAAKTHRPHYHQECRLPWASWEPQLNSEVQAFNHNSWSSSLGWNVVSGSFYYSYCFQDTGRSVGSRTAPKHLSHQSGEVLLIQERRCRELLSREPTPGVHSTKLMSESDVSDAAGLNPFGATCTQQHGAGPPIDAVMYRHVVYICNAKQQPDPPPPAAISISPLPVQMSAFTSSAIKGSAAAAGSTPT